MTAYDPLHGPGDELAPPAAMDVEVRLAREVLEQTANANIHDHQAMVLAATRLDHRLRALLAAIEAGAGESDD